MKSALLYFLMYFLIAGIRWVGFAVFNDYLISLMIASGVVFCAFAFHIYRKKNLLLFVPMVLLLFWYEIGFFFNFYVYPGYRP